MDEREVADQCDGAAPGRVVRERGMNTVETVCVIVVLLALAALVIGLVLSSGSGVLNQG